MELTFADYYKIHRILLITLGLWPWQKPVIKRIYLLLFFSIFVSCILAQAASLITMGYNVERLLRVCAYSIPCMIYFLKYYISSINTDNSPEGIALLQMKKVIEGIQKDWDSFECKAKYRIVQRRAEIGRHVTVIVIPVFCTAVIFYTSFPILTPILLDVVAPLEESRPLQPTLMEYFVDQQTYFYPILLHTFVVISISCMIVVATDTSFIMYMQHIFGMLEVISYSLREILSEDCSRISIPSHVFLMQRKLAGIINLHIKVLEFCSFAQNNFAGVYIIIIPLGVASTCTNLYTLARATTESHFDETFITAVFLLLHYAYCFYINYLGQKMIDSSTEIFKTTYDTHWYMAPVTIQKSLILIIQRSMESVKLLVGNIFVASFEGFILLVNLSVSYFMMIHATC